MGFILKSKKYNLKKADLKEETKDCINPGRGWYHIYTFAVGKTQPEELLYLPFEEKESIALVLINIGRYSAEEIDEEGLCFIEKVLSVFAQAKKEVILRIIYDNEGKGMEREPSLFSLVLRHMEQIGPVVLRHASHIMVAQGLFIGSWGEMHSSKFLSEKHLKKMFETWKKATGGSVPISFRRPVQCRQVLKEGEYEIGVFDDAMFASQNHLGTFGQQPQSSAGWKQPWCMEEETAYIRLSARNVPCGGEAVCGENDSSPEETVQLLQNMNISYLNNVYDERILNRWKEQMYGQESLYHYIGNHLGYRLIVREVIYTDKKCGLLRILVENTGFSALCDRADINLVVQKEKESSSIPVSYDIRNLLPGKKEEIKIELSERLERGSRLFLEILRKKDKESIRFANRGAEEQMLLGELE